MCDEFVRFEDIFKWMTKDLASSHFETGYEKVVEKMKRFLNFLVFLTLFYISSAAVRINVYWIVSL